MKKIFRKHVEKETNNENITDIVRKTRELQKQVEYYNAVKEKVQSYFDFEVPDYVALDIADEEYYEHFCLMVNLASMNNRITKENAEELKERVKKICNVENRYDRLSIKLDDEEE